MLEYLNKKFINSSLKVKIELYLLPIFIFILICILFYDPKAYTETTIEIIKNEKQIAKLEVTTTKLLSTIHEIANHNNIIILTDEIINNVIFLRGKTNESNLFNFIKDIENINNFSNIIEFNMYKINNSKIYDFELKIDFSKYYTKNIQSIYIPNKNNFKLGAIVDDYALINGIWLKIDDDINGYKLFEINMDYVILYKNDDKLKLEIEHGKYSKNFN